MADRQWSITPRVVRFVVAAQLLVTTVLAASVALMVWSPPVTVRDRQIMLLMDKVREQGLVITQLREHNRALAAWEASREEWEREKAEEAASRRSAQAFQMAVLDQLDGIEEACREPSAR